MVSITSPMMDGRHNLLLPWWGSHQQFVLQCQHMITTEGANKCEYYSTPSCGGSCSHLQHSQLWPTNLKSVR